MLTPNRLVVLLLLGAPGFPAAAAERLLYSVGHEEGRGPGFTRTEIFALDPATGRRELVFTDAGLPVVLLPDRPSGIRSWVMGAAGNAVLARAAERRAFPGGWAESPAGIYELSTDGTNRARKVTDVLGEHPLRLLVCDPAGRRVAYLNENAGAPTLFVHDIATGGAGSLYGLRLSPSRRLIAYTTENGARTEEQVWLLDLDTGKETALFALPYRPIKPPHLSLVGWLDR